MTIAPVALGQIIDPTTFGNAVADAVNWNGGRWRRNANQSCGSGALTAIVWDTEDQDPDSMVPIPSSIITIPVAGVWSIAVSMVAAGATTCPRLLLDIAITSSLTAMTSTYRACAPGEDVVSGGFTWRLAAGDSLQVRLFHIQGAAVNFTGRMVMNHGIAA